MYACMYVYVKILYLLIRYITKETSWVQQTKWTTVESIRKKARSWNFSKNLDLSQ